MGRRQYGYSQSMNKKNKVRLKPWVIVVFGIIFAGLIVWAAIMAFGGSVSTKAIEFKRENINAVVIRDEKVVEIAAFGKVIYNVDEGSTVAMNQQVAQVYKWGHSENDFKDLINIQDQIYSNQVHQKSGDIVNSELDEIQGRIDSKNREISIAIKNANRNELIRLSRELSLILEERSKFLKKVIQADQILKDLYASEERIIQKLESSRETILAIDSGMISFNIDMYSSLLNANSISKISVEDVDKTLAKQTIGGARDTNTSSIYKMANTNRWFLAIATSRRDNYFMAAGNVYNIELSGFYDKTYTGTVVYASRESNRSIYVLEINDDISEIMDVRSVKMTISGTFSGYAIPKKAVTFKDEKALIKLEGNSKPLPIEIISEDEKEYIFRSEGFIVQPGSRYEKAAEER